MKANSSNNTQRDSATTEIAAFEGAFPKKKSGQGKAGFNFWTDVLAFLTFLISTISGVVLMRAPDAYGAETSLPNGDMLWGLSRLEWLHLHSNISLIFVALMAVHLAMHWRWVTSRLGRLVPPQS